MKKAKVISSAVWVRVLPDISSGKVDILYKDDIIDVIDDDKGWLRHSKGWSCIENIEGLHIEMLSDDGNIRTISRPNNRNISTFAEVEGAGPVVSTPDIDAEEIYSLDETTGMYGGEDSGKYFIKKMRGIHAMPYQFMESVDKRSSDDSVFGRKYAEKIVAKIPLLLLTPGNPKFMKGFDKDSKKNIITYAKDRKVGGIDDLINKSSGKIYSFQSNYADYYSFVNPMCQRMSRYLGVHDKTIDNKRIGSYEWEKYANEAFKNFTSSKENVAFYIDADTQISESFSNSTGQSSLDGGADKLSDMGREIQFFLGGGAGIEYDKLKEESALEDVDKFINKFSGIAPKRLMENLKQGYTSVINGGKMIFPEIWTDSSFSRSYSISIKLRTPDADNLSWFMNIGVPLMHLICLAAPQQLGVNGFKSPFLIRGYYKGFFNCDMGIITDMNISKGAKGRWTSDGLPTEIDVSFTLKDLYQIMSITSDKNMGDLISNTTLLDYIANLCGINVNKPDLERSIDLAFMTVKNKLSDIITFDGFIGVENALSNIINDIFKR